MATSYSNELNGLLNASPGAFADGKVAGGRLRRYRATIDLASQVAGEIINLCRVPDKSVFAYGVLNTDTSLGTATVKIGHDDDDDIYRSAATFTATNAPTMFGRNLGVQEGALTEQKVIFATTATAALPASGTLVIDLYFSQA